MPPYDEVLLIMLGPVDLAGTNSQICLCLKDKEHLFIVNINTLYITSFNLHYVCFKGSVICVLCYPIWNSPPPFFPQGLNTSHNS